MDQVQADLLLQELFDEWYASLIRYGLKISRDRTVVEESVQQGMWLLYRELRRGAEIPNPKAWTLLVVKREIWRNVRSLNQQHAVESDTLVAVAEQEVTEERAGAPDLSDFLGFLSEREREILLLRLESMKYREIATVLGISPNSVNRFLARAIAKIRKHCLGADPKRTGLAQAAKGRK
jgi:RNA polymerase sigma factor (sigma-70 family)